jgi:hypothetical protein
MSLRAADFDASGPLLLERPYCSVYVSCSTELQTDPQRVRALALRQGNVWLDDLDYSVLWGRLFGECEPWGGTSTWSAAARAGL